MSAASLGVIALSLFASDASSLPKSAQKLTLRQAFQVDSARNTWYHSYEKARDESVKSQLPMVLHFEAKWCGSCQTMSREVLSNKRVQKHLGLRVIGARIDADRNRDLLHQFHVALLPCDVLIDVDGRILAQESGYRSLDQYTASLEHLAASRRAPYSWHNVKLGREALAQKRLSTLPSVVTRRGGVIVGLAGYSPVSMVRTNDWATGNRNYAAIHDGVMYYMQNAEELKAFQAEPGKYVPRLHGCDPVVLSNRGAPLPGKIQLGAFFEGHLYFFASEASRKLFKKNPALYLRKAKAVRGRDLQAAI